MAGYIDKKAVLVSKLMKKKGRAAAVNAKCCECIYDPEVAGAGSWRRQVENCTSGNCPLYNYRPLTTGGKDDDDDEITVTVEGVDENGSTEKSE